MIKGAHTHKIKLLLNSEMLKYCQEVAFIVTKIYLLSSEGKSCRSDGRGQIEALDDFLPLFLIDDFDEAASKSD